MAGTRTVTEPRVVAGSTITVEYGFDFDDTWDSYDWLLGPNDSGWRDPSALDLSTDITVTVTGGEVRLRYFRVQGGASRPWREGVLNEGNTPIVFPTQTGPNPKVVGDLAGAEIVSLD